MPTSEDPWNRRSPDNPSPDFSRRRYRSILDGKRERYSTRLQERYSTRLSGRYSTRLRERYLTTLRERYSTRLWGRYRTRWRERCSTALRRLHSTRLSERGSTTLQGMLLTWLWEFHSTKLRKWCSTRLRERYSTRLREQYSTRLREQHSTRFRERHSTRLLEQYSTRLRERHLARLRERQVTRLVDFFDEVRTVPSVFHQVMKQTLQALSVIPTTEDVARACLHKLQTICDHNATLPSSNVVLGELARVGDGPIALGAIADVWEGTHGSNKVSIKCLRVPLTDNDSLKKVCILCGASLSHLLKDTCGPCSHSSKRSFCGKI